MLCDDPEGWMEVGGGSVLCDDPERWMEVGGAQEGVDICIHTADSLCHTAETHSIVEQLHSKIKFKKETCSF